ncbi:MAG: SET domain-containing protein-lysine N-methyltransferase [Chitinophagaceae bacterium]|nr:SET domain-containing protein-lysine N-methyltransferase [Chitinophagaceae bacterium]
MILPGIFTACTDDKGWGVFTALPIAADTLVEVSPVIILSAEEKKLIDQTRLFNYIFDWQLDQCCMAMGYIPIYNHSYHSNSEYFQDYETGTISIRTVRDIAAGEELTINYNGDWDNQKPVWFEALP